MTLATDIVNDLINTFYAADGIDISAAIYTPAYVAPALPAPVTVYVRLEEEDGALLGMSGIHYWIQAMTSSVSMMKPKETIVIGGVTYKIKESSKPISKDESVVELSID